MFKNIFNFISQHIVLYLFRKISVGNITFYVIDSNRKYVFGDIDSKLKSEIVVNDRSFFQDLLLRQGMGFAESYMDGKWESESLYNSLDILAKNPQLSINRRLTNFLLYIYAPIKYIYTKFKLYFQKDERNDIKKHYDLSNEMFSLFLDKSMAYSCAVFEEPQSSLYEAQKNKFKIISNELQIKSKDKFLDIGFGWGGLCEQIYNNFHCDIDAITLSEEQLKYVTHNDKISSEINFKLMDFRLLNGKFDKIASIEMLEALNYTQISVFFQKIQNILNYNGKLFIQVITIPESRFGSYKSNTDFIQKYIFPNGMIHPLNRIIDSADKYGGLKIEKVTDISSHYVKTLQLWKNNFNKNKKKIIDLGYDDVFIKKWNYYFDYCSAGFNNKLIGTSQIVFSNSKE